MELIDGNKIAADLIAELKSQVAALPGRPPSERRQAKRIQAVEDKQARRERKAARKARREDE